MSNPSLTLYRGDGSCALASHLLLQYTSLPYTTVPLQPSPSGLEAVDGSLTSTQYRSLVPSGYVPALKFQHPNNTHDIITETPAILTYIAGLVPDRELLGTGTLERARVSEWLTWLCGSLHGDAWIAFLLPHRKAGPDVPGASEEVLAVIKENGRRLIMKGNERVEGRVGEDGYAVGGRLTVVDMYLLVFWVWGVRFLGLEMGRMYLRWRRGVEALLRMEAVVKVLDLENQREWAELD